MQTTLAPTADGRMPYFPALDGVRAYCILLVVYNHLKTNGHLKLPINGHLGVDLFFLLSGFLITTLLLREQHFTGRLDFPAFYWRRFFRIAPVYFVALALYIAVTQLLSMHDKWVQLRAGLPYFLTMTNEFAREPNSGNVFTHTWTLGIEEKFYLLWPLLLFVLAPTSRARVIAALVGAAILTTLLFSPFNAAAYYAIAYSGLLLGSILAIVLTSQRADAFYTALRRTPPIVACAVLALGFYLNHTTNSEFPFDLCAALFLAHLIVVPSWLQAVHAWSPFTWLGRRSYSMYLVHPLCLNAIESRIAITSATRAIAALALGFAVTAAVAAILYITVEQPCRNFGRRWLTRRHEIAAAI